MKTSFLAEAGDAYSLPMTKLLEKALETVRRLPPDSQDEIARAMLTLAGDEGEPEPIDPAHLRFAASTHEAAFYAACNL